MRIIIFTEDSYGIGFFKKLIGRLKSENVIQRQTQVDVKRFYGKCNPKLKGQILAQAMNQDFRSIVIVADGDGEEPNKVEQRIQEHIPHAYKNVVKIVVIQHEIEEWICVSKGIRIDDKPSKILKQQLNYEKFKLPDFADDLDISITNTCESFKKLLSFIR